MAEEQSTTPNRTMQAAVLGGAVVLVAIALIAYFAFTGSGGNDTGSNQAANGDAELGVIEDNRPEVGDDAPDFALLDARDGETVRRLSDYEGTPVVLNFWATWCGPCREEMPDFQAAKDALGDDVDFLLVNTQEPQERAAEFLQELEISLPAVLDSDGEITQHYRVSGMPTTFFIDSEGNIAAAGRGMVTEEALREQLANMGLEY